MQWLPHKQIFVTAHTINISGNNQYMKFVFGQKDFEYLKQKIHSHFHRFHV